MSLLAMSFSGSVMTLAVLVIRILGRRILPRRAFPVLWGLVVLRLLVPFTLRSPTSVYGAVPLPSSPLPVPRLLDAPFPAAMPAAPTAESGPPLWALAWGLGTALWAGYFTLAYLRCLREFRTALPVKSEWADTWLARHPLRRKTVLRQSDRLSSPLTYGVLRPVILLPSSLDWENPKTLAHILTHETIHIRRFDALGKLLLAAAFTLHWWNPAVWLLYRLAGQDMELACDEAAVRILGAEFGPSAQRDYAKTLLLMEERRSLSLFNAFAHPVLERRILAIMKWKKTTVPALLASVLLISGVAAAFATSAETGELTPVPGASLTEEEYQKLSALRPEGYRRMTVAQFQDRIWTASDSPEFQALLDRVVADEALYRQRDQQETSGFLFYVLCPLINDQWQTRQFDGSAQRDFGSGKSTLVEYTLTAAILDPKGLTVEEYARAREDVARELQRFLDRQTGPDGLEAAISAECRRLEDSCGSEALKLELDFVMNDQEPTPDPVPVPESLQEREPREFPNGTETDYRSLLALRTPGYQDLSLREFNQLLLDWADQDYERMERVNTDIGLNSFQVELTEEELAFLQWSVRLSGEENGRLVRSIYTRRPEEDCQIGGIEMEKADSDGSWCSLWYQFFYRVHDKDALTVAQRDRCVTGFVEAVRQFFKETDLRQLMKMTEADAAERIEALAQSNSTELLTISVSQDHIQFEHQEERPAG